jgi:hypothetical protein
MRQDIERDLAVELVVVDQEHLVHEPPSLNHRDSTDDSGFVSVAKPSMSVSRLS